MTHVNILYDQARDKIEKGLWSGPSVFEIYTKDGEHFKYSYVSHSPFELGKIYYGKKGVAFVIDKDFMDFGLVGAKRIREITYPDAKLKQEHTRHMPEVEVSKPLKGGGLFVLIRKKPEEFTLREVLEFYGGRLDPKHVAWILSSLYNVNCFLDIIGIVHQDISLDSYFINPADHNGRLVGGWWFAAVAGRSVTVVPTRTANYAPPDFKIRKKAHRLVDSELIRLVGRELLGDPIGTKLRQDDSVPKPLRDWLLGTYSHSAFEEYRIWSKQILKESFGARRFVKLEYPPSAATVN